MFVVYVAHPIGGDVEANLAHLRHVIKCINSDFQDVVPFCPYYADVCALDDSIPEHRERGMKNNAHYFTLGFIKELWLTGPHLSKGMAIERELARERGIPVFDFINYF